LGEDLTYDPAGHFGPEHSGRISFGGFMNFPVTLATKSDALVMRALTAFELLVMNLD
jgi:hypothetical protein